MKITRFVKVFCVVLVLFLGSLGGCDCDEDNSYRAPRSAPPPDPNARPLVPEVTPFALNAAYPSTGSNLTIGIPLSGMRALFDGLTINIGENPAWEEDFYLIDAFVVLRTVNFSEDIDETDLWKEIWEGEATITISGTYHWKDGTITDAHLLIVSDGTHTSAGGPPGRPAVVSHFEGSYDGSFLVNGAIAEPYKAPPEGTTITFQSSGPSTFTEDPGATGGPDTRQDTIWFGKGLPFVVR